MFEDELGRWYSFHSFPFLAWDLIKHAPEGHMHVQFF